MSLSKNYFIKKIGLIEASGKDLIDFINRMSTNDFRKFRTDEFRKTVLTTDKGRIIDLVNVLNLRDRQPILTSYNFQDKIISHLNKYIIMDEVVLEKSKNEYVNFVITGEDLRNFAKKIFNIDIENGKAFLLDNDAYLFYDDFKFNTLNLVCKENEIDKYKKNLEGLEEINAEEHEYRRVTSGLPEGENEFNEQINPMECGLDKYISFTKGCYIGQEVIARLDSQGKRPKQIVKIDSDHKINKDDKIYSEDKEVGFVSSVSGQDNKTAALGFIRSVNLDYAKPYFVSNNGSKFEINISKII